MLIEVEIESVLGKSLIAFKRPVRPNIGDLTIGVHNIGRVVKIEDMLDYQNYLIDDGSSLINPVKIIGDPDDFIFPEDFQEGDQIFIECNGDKKNPIPKESDSKIILVKIK